MRSVDAKRISGEVVKVTGKSVIDVIEYKESLQISVNAVVKEIVKL